MLVVERASFQVELTGELFSDALDGALTIASSEDISTVVGNARAELTTLLHKVLL